MTYQVEHLQNENEAIIHVDMDIRGISPMGPYSEDEVSEKICRVEGIVGIKEAHKYHLVIEKGRLFEWDDVIPDVIDIIRENFDPEGELEKLPPFVKTWK